MEFDSREALDRYYRTAQQIEALRFRPVSSIRSVLMRSVSVYALMAARAA